MARLETLQAASFKGVEFFVFSESLPEEGRKTVLHEYVNSDQRFVEDLGQLPSKFELRGYVSGEDYQARAKNLIRVLNEKGPGRLVLPVFGAQDKAYALSYKIDASQQSVGEIAFDMSFALGRPTAGPAEAKKSKEDVFTGGDAARAAIQASFEALWQIPANAAESIVAQSDILAAIDTTVDQVKELVPSDFLTGIFNIQTAARYQIPTLSRQSFQIGSLLIGVDPRSPGLWQSISLGLSNAINAGSDQADVLFDSVLALADYGSGLSLTLDSIRGSVLTQLPSGGTVSLWPETTASRIRRNQNRLAILNVTRVAALVTAYELAAARGYRTQAEVNETRQRLESAHELLMRFDTSDIAVIQSDDTVRQAVETIRISALDVIEQKIQEVFGTSVRNLRVPTSALIESYNLYAEEFSTGDGIGARAIELRRLNPSQRVISMFGDVFVFKG